MSARQLIISRTLWTARRKFRNGRLAVARRDGDKARIAHWQSLATHAAAVVKRRDEQLRHLAAAEPLRTKALREAEHLIGVMERGGNNRGADVERIIKANGGAAGEPWCGDFVAYCYRRAGSTAVSRAWASVYWLGSVTGLSTTRTPKPGDIARYTFSHTGIYVRTIRPGLIETIEGNTGRSGATSDSSTGGDGVYRKQRSTSLVLNYRRVLR